MLLVAITIMGCDEGQIGLDEVDTSSDSQVVISEGPVEGGQIILPLTTFNTLNPLRTQNQHYFHFSKLIFEGLFEFNNDLNLEEQLADSYKINEDGTVVEVKLKDNVFWHDGEKLKAEDIIFTIDTIKYAKDDSSYGEMFLESFGVYQSVNIGKIIKASALDDRNIIIEFDSGISNALEILTFPIIPKHVFTTGRPNNADFLKALETNNYKVVGTGPYKFDSYDKMKQIILRSNENFREGKPYIDEIIGRVIGREKDILTAFETGQINMATTLDVDWEKYNQNPRINTLEYISPNYEFIGFNFTREIFSGEEGQVLRKAIAYGINRQRIIETVYLGHGTQIDVPIHPNSWLLSEDANSFGYNLNQAKAELKKIGWEDRDGDGLLEDINGENMSLKILTNSYNLMRQKTAEMIREDLQELGIIVTIESEYEKASIDQEEFQEEWLEIKEQLNKGEYDIILLGWQLSVIPELSFAFHSSRISSNTNFIRYSNEEMDYILEEIFSEGNRMKKKGLYEKLQKHIVTDLPYVSLFFKNNALLVDSKVIGDLNPIFINPYKGIEKSYIQKSSNNCRSGGTADAVA